MKTSDFYFDLPQELIAQYPPEKRGTSRMMLLSRKDGTFSDMNVRDIVNYFGPDDVMVVNNTRVRKARLYGTSHTGGRVEFFLMKPLDMKKWEVICKKSRKQTVNKTYDFPECVTGTIIEDRNDSKIIEFSEYLTDDYLDRNAHVPLPPYIKRSDEEADSERYQTVYAKETGSVAAPTAGLHFTDEILDAIRARGTEILEVTLHVGAGTFFPVRSENIEDHKMHTEEYSISREVAEKLNAAKRAGKKITAVGTTSMRTLESACIDGIIPEGRSATSIFIYPGYKFKFVDRLFTNFHTPESTLLMLVSAFASEDLIKKAYAHAVEERYRFFSYGDCMLIL
ncbi:MAG: tRNA preQ1(34) S-adenosylmethionine ribosyltransferase-isomerase QueA [Spirochaetia bacterium]|nr:tRNA preQ1(34) S-adenosylmethionine ribosyltransferase-isomerase QueA [Spirochaetia bacterium]